MTTLIIILTIAAIVGLLIERNRLIDSNRDLKNRLSDLEDVTSKQKVRISNLEIYNSELSKYQGIADADKEAQEILRVANLTSNTLKASAASLLEEAKNESKKVISNANIKADEIAGDALKALRDAKEFESTVKAMKNIIDGYGNEYLMPTFSILDDLAEEFGFTEAGQRLKQAREKTRQMLTKHNIAARCDYVENYRRTTAINFVLDAFNGKVDSVLSKVKKDNYGILDQRIRDAYQIVNNNGRAFKNAIITPEYLDARLDELKWAVITQELKWKEQEEQRQLREQIREEEKARRDFEKAIQEAAKEQETLKKLIEKAHKEVAKANDEQKALYEERVVLLEEKLKEAQEKNQRALSMAQQTKSGNVYIISNIGSFGEDVFKIGMTRRLEPIDRVRELGDASVPFEFDVHSMIYSDDAPALERALHKKFLSLQINKVNPRKEFFKVSLTDIQKEVEGMGLDVKWTMEAQAKQYRESLIIQEAIMNNKQQRLEWEAYQQKLDLELEPQEEANEVS